MIKAVKDKIVVELMRAERTKGGLILPENSTDPQGYGKVISIGEDVLNIQVGDVLVFHARGGMDTLIDNSIFRILKYDEVYGILENDEIKNTLKSLHVGSSSEGKPLPIQPKPTIVS